MGNQVLIEIKRPSDDLLPVKKPAETPILKMGSERSAPISKPCIESMLPSVTNGRRRGNGIDIGATPS